MKSILFLCLMIIALLSRSGEKSDTGFAGVWAGNVLIDGQNYDGMISIVLLNKTTFAGNLLLRQTGKLINSTPFNGTIIGNQATGQTVDHKPASVKLTLANNAIIAVFKNDEGSLTVRFVRNATVSRNTPASAGPTKTDSAPQSHAVARSVNRGHDPNLSATNWMTKETTSNFLTKRFKTLLADGTIDGYKISFMPSMGQYDNPQPEPDKTIERWKQQGVRWYTTDNSVICLTFPEGTECFRYQISDDDLKFYNNEGQLMMRWSVAY